MTVELTWKDIDQIWGWYEASAGESANSRDETMFRLLEKLGIKAHEMDLYLPDPSHFIKSHQPVIMAQRKAIIEYCERHKINPTGNL